MTTKASVLVLVTVSLLFTFAFAEDAPPMPEPTPGHEVLETWVGSWEGGGEMAPGPWGPGGEMTWTEECAWFEGSHFHVVCESEGSGAMGEMKGLGIISYDPATEVYKHFGIDTTGWSGYSTGKRSGETFVFESEEMMGGTKIYGRLTLTMKTPEHMVFKWEMSEDGETWTVMMKGETKKV